MTVDEIVAQMEPAALELGFLDSLGEAATCSAAISLKRIADALEKQNEIADRVTSGHYNLGIEE